MQVISSRITTVIIQVVRTIKEMITVSQYKKNNGEKLKLIMIVLIFKYNSKLIYKLKYFLGPKIRSTNLNGQNLVSGLKTLGWVYASPTSVTQQNNTYYKFKYLWWRGELNNCRFNSSTCCNYSKLILQLFIIDVMLTKKQTWKKFINSRCSESCRRSER